MTQKIRVSILDDHQTIIDGYMYRLSRAPEIEVVGTAVYGEDLEKVLATHPTDVLILDVSVPTSPANHNPYPILHTIPKLLQAYPDLTVLVISMHNQRPLIQAVIEAGASGYILKEDHASLRELGSVVQAIANGGVYFSLAAHMQLLKRPAGELVGPPSPRQLQALSLCAAYPDSTTAELAARLGVANSTMRNLLSTIYLRLNVRTRAAAISKARQAGLISPDSNTL